MKSRFHSWNRNLIAGLLQYGIDLHGWFIIQWRRIETLGRNLSGNLHRLMNLAFHNLRRKEMARPQEQFDIPETDEGCTVVQVDGDSPMLVKDNATYQDVLDAPDHLVAELIGGKLYLMNAPKGPHVLVTSMLGLILGNAFMLQNGGPGGWLILVEPGWHLNKGFKLFRPDLAGWHLVNQNMEFIQDDITLTPDWVCEVLSPSTRKKDLEIKLPEYAQAGISYSWIIDPIAKTLKAYELQSGSWVQIADLQDDDAVSVPPFDAITFNLAKFWVD